MKIICTYLLVIVSLFLIIPSNMWNINHMNLTENCCSHCPTEDDQETSQETKDECTNGICNPFSQCNCCIGFILFLEANQQEKIISHFIEFESYIPKVDFKLVQKHWHPPKIG